MRFQLRAKRPISTTRAAQLVSLQSRRHPRWHLQAFSRGGSALEFRVQQLQLLRQQVTLLAVI